MSGPTTFTITEFPVEAGRYAGSSLYTATAGSRTILIEAPNGMFEPNQTATAILTDVGFAKATGGKADYWIGASHSF